MRRAIHRQRLVAASALLLALGGSTLPAAASHAAFAKPTWLRQIGQPGHAFVYPWGMATEPDGSVVVGDYNNYDIKVFSPSGTLLRTFGSRGTQLPAMGQPYGLAVDRNDGSVYVADVSHHGALKFSAQGVYQYFVPNPGGHYNPFVATDSKGDLYIISSSNVSRTNPNLIYEFDNTGQQINVFGTNGSSCSAGQFGMLRGLDVDAADNLYVNDVENRCIQVFDSHGTFLRSFGDSTQLSNNTRGLTIDRTNGIVYVADSARQVVDVFSTDGTPLGTLGTPGSEEGQLGGPRNVAVGLDGTVYVSDYTYWRVNAYNPLSLGGAFLHQIPDPVVPPPPGGLNNTVGVAVSPLTGNVYVSDTFNQRVQEFDGTGTVITTWGSRLPDLAGQYALDYPRGIAVDPTTGNVWVKDTRSGYVKQYTASGTFVSEFGGQGSGPTQFFYAVGAAVGPDGSLYLPDGGNLRLKRTDPSGNPMWIVPCGTAGASVAGYYGCSSAALDAAGNVYAASPNQGVVDVFSSTGTLLRTIGATAPNGRLSLPYGVAVHGSTLYVSEAGANRVSVFTLTGSYVGGWGSFGSAHGQFNRPMQLAVDAGGDVYVNDYGNERIEVFAP